MRGEQRRLAGGGAPATSARVTTGALAQPPAAVARQLPIATGVALPMAAAAPVISMTPRGMPLAQATGELVVSGDGPSSYTGVVARAVPLGHAKQQDCRTALRMMAQTMPESAALMEVFRTIEAKGPPAGMLRGDFTALTLQVREKWGSDVWTRSVMVQHASVLKLFPEDRREPEPEPESRAYQYGGDGAYGGGQRPRSATSPAAYGGGRASPSYSGRSPTAATGSYGGGGGVSSPTTSRSYGGGGGGSPQSRAPIVGGRSPQSRAPIVGGGGTALTGRSSPIVGGGAAAAADDSDDDDDEGEAEMAAAMEHVRQLGEIRELQRRNIREGVGDAEGTDERVVAMYAGLIQTAGLTYQGVVQHDKVAKGVTKATGLDRIPAHRNGSRTDCSLCLEEMPIGLRVAKLPCCGNIFHFSVVRPHEKWAEDPNQESCCGIENCLEQVGSCPLCRQDLHKML